MRSGERRHHGTARVPVAGAWVVGLGLLAALGCDPGADRISRPRATSELVKDYVALGDAFTAGAQSGALANRHQLDSYPAILAEHFGVGLTPTSAMTQPLISNPGFPITRPVVAAGHFTVASRAPLELVRAPWNDPGLLNDRAQMHEVMELNDEQAFPFRNLAAPGVYAYDVRFALDSLTTWTGTFAGAPSYLIETVLRPGRREPAGADSVTLLDDALSRSPSLTTVWLGTSELLDAVRAGGTAPYDASTFGAHLGAIVDSLVAAGSEVVIGTIPDVTRLPLVDALPRHVIGGDGEPATDPVTGDRVPLLGEGSRESRLAPGVTELDPDTRVLLDARVAIARGAGIPDPVLVRRIVAAEGVSESEAWARLARRYPDHGAALPDALTLTRAERGGVEILLDAYNAEIRSVATSRDAVVVDLEATFREWDAGIALGGIPLSDELLVGGLISLDGVHPTSLGYALVAAAFVDAINAAFGTDVPAVDVGRYFVAPELPSGAPGGAPDEP